LTYTVYIKSVSNKPSLQLTKMRWSRYEFHETPSFATSDFSERLIRLCYVFCVAGLTERVRNDQLIPAAKVAHVKDLYNSYL